MAQAHHLSTPSAIALSALTAASLFVHGMQIEEMHKGSLVLPLALGAYKAMEGSADLTDLTHTHTEQTSVAEALQHLGSPDTSRILPREDTRKHVLSKKVVKGVHTFDGYHLPHESI